MLSKVPTSLLWIFESKDLTGRKYLRDLDFIKEHTAVDYVTISPRDGVRLQNLQQCHAAFSELVDYAHKLGLKICLHLVTSEGFYHALFATDNPPAVDQAELFATLNLCSDFSLKVCI